MNAEDYVWVGIVNPEDVKPGVTLITPLAFNDEGMWMPILPDACQQCFPNNGKAAIFARNLSGNKVVRLWLFQPERNEQIKDPSAHHYSHYQVVDEIEPAPFAQIFDWTSRAGSTADLLDLLANGIVSKDCYCQYIYIRFQSFVYGPIKLEPDAELLKPWEYLQSSNTGGQPLYVYKYLLLKESVFDLTHLHRQCYFLNENMLETPIGKEDWSLPQVVIKRVLQASNEDLTETENHIHLVNKRIRDLARLSSQEGPLVLQLEPATIKRAQYIVSNHIERLQDLRTILKQLPAEHPLMKAARAWEIQARSKEIEQEAERLSQGKRDQLQQLQSMVKETEARLSQIQKAEDKTQQLVSLSLYQNGLQTAVSAHELTWGSKDVSESVKVRLQGIQNRWVQAAHQAGINSISVRVCVAALLAGLIPAMTGEVIIPTWKAVSRVIAHGRVVLVPVSLTALTTLDLIGTIDSHRQMFVPAVGGLADCILQAQLHPDDLVLIVLEGIDRVPGMPVYVPLLRQYIEMRQAESPSAGVTPINLFHPRALASNDPYLKLAWFTLPRNILLAVTLDGESNSLPLSPICDRWLVQRELARSKPAFASAKKSPLTCSGVSLEQWQSWEQEVRSKTTVSADLQDHLDHRQQAFHAALTILNVKDPDAVVEDIWPEQFQQDDEETDK